MKWILLWLVPSVLANLLFGLPIAFCLAIVGFVVGFFWLMPKDYRPSGDNF